MISDLAVLLVEIQLALAVGILIVLGARTWVRRQFGAGAAYRLWLVVPVLAFSVMVPARTIVSEVTPSFIATAPESIVKSEYYSDKKTKSYDEALPVIDTDKLTVSAPTVTVAPTIPPEVQQADSSARVPAPLIIVGLWALGVLAFSTLLFLQQRRFEASLGRLEAIDPNDRTMVRAASDHVGPALVGLRAPRIVLPASFGTDFTEKERTLIIAHEQVHLRRGDAQANGIAAAVLCFAWFNPFAHIAINRFRLDQELACDAEVIRRHPNQRRFYGETMLKSQLRGKAAPLTCHWNPEHPLKERISMLSLPTPSAAQRIAGTSLSFLVAASAGAIAWASQPPTVEEIEVPSEQKTEDTASKELEKELAGFDPLLPTSDGETYDVKGIEIEDAVAVVTVIPEQRRDYEVTIRGNGTAKLRERRGKLYIDGGLPDAKKNCSGVEASDVSRNPDGLNVVIRAPMNVDLNVNGITFTEVGQTKNADLSFGGCGTAKVKDTLGPLDISFHGVIDGVFGDVKGDLDISAHGSSSSRGGNVKGAIDMSAHGSSDLVLKNVYEQADVSVHGSADAKIGNIGGPLDLSIHGSGDLEVGDVTGNLDLSAHGSASLEMASVKGNADISAHGAARASIKRIAGEYLDFSAHGAASFSIGDGTITRMDADLRGASKVKFGGEVKYLTVDAREAGSVYVATADRVELDNPNPRGPVRVKTKTGSYR